MYEFHGWFGLAESAEDWDEGTLDAGIVELEGRLSKIAWATGAAVLRIFNGGYFLSVEGLINRRRDEARELDGLLEFVAQRFPGSWGLLYERAEDMPEPPGPGSFRVRVMAKGVLTHREDPFLSPCQPTIED